MTFYARSGVMRGSPATDTELQLCFTIIEQNFWHINSFPPFPTLFCTKKTGPPGILTFTRMATTTNIGQRRSRPPREAIRSKIHFKNIRPISLRTLFSCRIQIPNSRPSTKAKPAHSFSLHHATVCNASLSWSSHRVYSQIRLYLCDI